MTATAAVAHVDDPADPRVADYVRLNDTALRRTTEPSQGIFIAEGELVVRRAVRHGYRLRSLLISQQHAAPLADVSDGVPVYVASPQVLEAVTGFDVHRGVLGSFDRRPLPDPADLLATATRVAVLEDMSNPTNVGAVFRCAAALGMDAVLLSATCADPLYRRSVRVSMGEALAVPYARLSRWPAELDLLHRNRFRVLALTPDDAATPLDALIPADRTALLLGAEGPGLSVAAMRHADELVRIPMTNGVDSLNVAAAAAVAFYVVGRRVTG